MTSQEMLRRWRSDLNEVLGGYFATGITTSIGGGGGDTFFTTSLSSVVDDALNGLELYIVDGDNAGLRREIVDWVQTTNKGTLLEAFPYQIASGVSFIVGEKGVFSDQEGLAWLNAGAIEVVNRLSNRALHDFLKSATTVGTASGSGYGTASLPTDIHKAPFAVILGVNPARIYDYQEQMSFYNDAWTTYKVLWNGNLAIRYKPDSSLTVSWKYCPKPTEITISVNCDLPERLHEAVVSYAVHKALMKKGMPAEANVVMRSFQEMINFLNSGAQEQVTLLAAPKA